MARQATAGHRLTASLAQRQQRGLAQLRLEPGEPLAVQDTGDLDAAVPGGGGQNHPRPSSRGDPEDRRHERHHPVAVKPGHGVAVPIGQIDQVIGQDRQQHGRFHTRHHGRAGSVIDPSVAQATS
jgi:hypothetical protein